MVIALLGVAMMAESLNLTTIVESQMKQGWNVFLQPIGFLVFFLATMSEMSRAPFDIAVAESEIVGGPFVEYSGMRWGCSISRSSRPFASTLHFPPPSS